MALLLTLLLLWGMEALGGWGVALLPLTLPALCVLTWERRYGALLLCVLVPAAVILALPFLHYAWFGFMTVVSWYAPVRTALLKLRAVWAQTVIALLLCVLVPAAVILALPFLHYAWFGFMTVVSWYAPVRTALLKLRAVWAQTVIALLLCNVGLAAGFVLLHLLGAHPLGGLDPAELSVLFLGIELLCVALDLAFTLLRRAYPRHIRRWLFV